MDQPDLLCTHNAMPPRDRIIPIHVSEGGQYLVIDLHSGLITSVDDFLLHPPVAQHCEEEGQSVYDGHSQAQFY